MFIFSVKNTKIFARAKARGLLISLSSYNSLIYQTNNTIPTNVDDYIKKKNGEFYDRQLKIQPRL